MYQGGKLSKGIKTSNGVLAGAQRDMGCDEYSSHPIFVLHYYYLWYPWVQGYYGKNSIGYICSVLDFPKYIWLDQDLNEEMTDRR